MSGSEAVLVTTSVDNLLNVRSALPDQTRGVFTSLTTTVNLFVALSGGDPSSLTITTITFVLGPCASVGTQDIAPVLGFMVMPEGGNSRLNVSVLAGMSGSVADAETKRGVNSSIV